MDGFISANKFAGAQPLERLDSGIVALSTLSPWVTVPAGERWVLYSLVGRFVSTATVGNRLYGYRLRDSSNVVLAQAQFVTVQVASTTRTVVWTAGTNRATAAAGASPNIYNEDPFPSLFVLMGGEDIEIFNVNATDGNDSVRMRLTFWRFL